MKGSYVDKSFYIYKENHFIIHLILNCLLFMGEARMQAKVTQQYLLLL